MTNVCESTSAKSRPELRIPTAAAQTRVVSGGEVWPIQRELSRHLKYMARARISEFESSQASHAVCSPRGAATLRPILQNTASASGPQGQSTKFDLRHTLFLQLLYPMVVIIRDYRSKRHRSGHSDLS